MQGVGMQSSAPVSLHAKVLAESLTSVCFLVVRSHLGVQGVGIKEKDALGRTAMQYACNEMVVNYLEKALNKILIYRECFEINLQVTLEGGGKYR